MKALLIGAALLALSTAPSFAAITCWYDEAGVYAGADDVQPGFPTGRATKGTKGVYAWGYTVDGGTVSGGAQACPKTVPIH
jgi:hypothetical protein